MYLLKKRKKNDEGLLGLSPLLSLDPVTLTISMFCRLAWPHNEYHFLRTVTERMFSGKVLKRDISFL